MASLSTPRVRLLATVLVAGCAGLVLSNLLELRGGAIVAKMSASSAFIGIAWLCGAAQSRYGRILLAGLVLSWFGDLFLLGTGGGFFLAGLATFLAGHVAYVVAFSTSYRVANRWSLLAVLPIAAIAWLVSAWLTPHLPADMVVPVRAYTIVISLMVIAAFGARGAGATVLIPVGATLFYMSDLSVAMMQFTEPVFPTYVWGLPLYYAGQLALALSVAHAPAVPERHE